MRHFLLILSFLSSISLFSQRAEIFDNKIDTATNMFWLSTNFSYCMPTKNLAKLFKNNFSAGASMTYKTSSNWTWTLNFNYMFGSKLRYNSVDSVRKLFGNLITESGNVVNGYGMEDIVYFEGRYWTINGGIGKIIPLDKKWRNSGLWLNANFGFFRHKIFIDIPDPSTTSMPCFEGDYKKGYDRRSSGFCMSQFVGYLFMRNHRVASFYAGVEFYEMWTKPDRNYIFTLGATEGMKANFSALIGFKVGWIVPLFEKKRNLTLYIY